MRNDAKKSAAERRELGAHYTPRAMAETLVARALKPLMEWPHAMQCASCDPSVALTNLLVIDTACGDGELLVAAADILGALLAQAYELEGIACAPEEARARIIENCLVGVDVDLSAIEAARARLGPGCELDCADALFDWNFDTDGRPTAFVGNPPFLGGRRISTIKGVPYQKRLMAEWTSANGGADLCTYFLLLAAHVLDQGGSKGTFSFICTNTISQGDTREAGLSWLLNEHRDVIYCADRDIRWPGAANVTVSLVHLANEELWREIGERDAFGVEYAPWQCTRPNNARGSTPLRRSSHPMSCGEKCDRRVTPKQHTGCGP